MQFRWLNQVPREHRLCAIVVVVVASVAMAACATYLSGFSIKDAADEYCESVDETRREIVRAQINLRIYPHTVTMECDNE